MSGKGEHHPNESCVDSGTGTNKDAKVKTRAEGGARARARRLLASELPVISRFVRLRLRFACGTENINTSTMRRAHRRIVVPGVPGVCCVRVQGKGQRLP